MLSLAQRHHIPEMMDDPECDPSQLEGALRGLAQVNRWLGGFSSLAKALEPLARSRTRLRILDVGTGLADIPVRLVRWGERHETEVEVVGVDLHEGTLDLARRYVEEVLGERSAHVQLRRADALDLPFEAGSFDVATASLFLHHFPDPVAVGVLEEMRRCAGGRVVVSDLHRHWVAYAGIRAVAALLPVSEMFAHDGPASVLQGFRSDEIEALARSAGLDGGRVRWQWAFRWVFSTIG